MARREGQRDLFTRRVRQMPAAPEFHLQCMVANTLRRWCTPGWLWTHIGHGGLRSKATAGQLHRAGLRPGWPDLILLSPEGRPHFLELKRRGCRLSEAQQCFASWCHEHGVCFHHHDEFKDVIATLRAWGAVRIRISA